MKSLQLDKGTWGRSRVGSEIERDICWLCMLLLRQIFHIIRERIIRMPGIEILPALEPSVIKFLVLERDCLKVSKWEFHLGEVFQIG